MKVVFICIMLLLLAACTAIVTEQNKQQSSTDLIEVWSANGRISIIQEQENWYAKFNWQQQHNDFQISFTGPLGETELQVSQINKHIVLQTPSVKRSSNDLEQLIYQETGWKLPVSSLKYWLQGQANPAISAETHYNKQQISDIIQSGWHIRYPKRMQVELLSGSHTSLPKKIIAEKGQTKIKLIITNWQVGITTMSSYAN